MKALITGLFRGLARALVRLLKNSPKGSYESIIFDAVYTAHGNFRSAT